MLGKLAGQAKLNPALVKELITAIFLQTRAVFFIEIARVTLARTEKNWNIFFSLTSVFVFFFTCISALELLFAQCFESSPEKFYEYMRQDYLHKKSLTNSLDLLEFKLKVSELDIWAGDVLLHLNEFPNLGVND